MASAKAKMKRGKRGEDPGTRVEKRWLSLTWADLNAWAGHRSVTRGRSYQRQGAVHELSVSPEGTLLASVQGTRCYTTQVWWAQDKQGNPALQSRCSCPIGMDQCKHAVAVVAAYLQALADEIDVPQVEADDPRWEMLCPESDTCSPDDVEENGAKLESKGERPAGKRSEAEIRADLTGRSQAQLIELLMSLIQRYPDVREEFREKIMLKQGDVQRLVRDTRREMRAVTAEPGWCNPWDGQGYIPDYSRLQQRLQRLIEFGQADEVVTLGKELLERGMEQVEQSHDEGETAMAISDCLETVFEGVAQSSLAPSAKVLFTIDAYLRDPFDVIGEAGDVILRARQGPEVWSEVADELHRRLSAMPEPRAGCNEFSRKYERDQITNWLGKALDNAGREDELTSLYEREARLTSSYERLVHFLKQRRQYDAAQRWAMEGIEQTRTTWPGIASHLADAMAELAQQRRQWKLAAAHAAWRFFQYPSCKTFQTLLTAAGKARCREKVRQYALHFLETGQSPIQMKPTGKQGRRLTTDPDWPLPVPEYQSLLMHETLNLEPRFDVLLDIALAETRPEEALHWYDKLKNKSANRRLRMGIGMGHDHADRVAEAVSESHPEHALAIYEDRLQAHLEPAKYSAYQACAAYLRKMRPIMKQLGREHEWQQRLDRIREDYRRRPRLMEILDEFDGQAIVRSKKRRRGNT